MNASNSSNASNDDVTREYIWGRESAVPLRFGPRGPEISVNVTRSAVSQERRDAATEAGTALQAWQRWPDSADGLRIGLVTDVLDLPDLRDAPGGAEAVTRCAGSLAWLLLAAGIHSAAQDVQGRARPFRGAAVLSLGAGYSSPAPAMAAAAEMAGLDRPHAVRLLVLITGTGDPYESARAEARRLQQTRCATLTICLSAPRQGTAAEAGTGVAPAEPPAVELTGDDDWAMLGLDLTAPIPAGRVGLAALDAMRRADRSRAL